MAAGDTLPRLGLGTRRGRAQQKTEAGCHQYERRARGEQQMARMPASELSRRGHGDPTLPSSLQSVKRQLLP